MIAIYNDTTISGNDYLALLCDLITGKQTYYYITGGLYQALGGDGSALYEYWN